jgi:hypothetical protein
MDLPPGPPLPCGEVQGMSFVCGADRPEDLALIPGTPWLVASGFSNGAGIKLVHIGKRTLRRWYTGEPGQLQRDATMFPECTSPPDAALFNAQGMNLRDVGDEMHLLYVSNHGGREAIEVFRIEERGEREPGLKWIGCVLMPADMAANSVASSSDGSILATVLLRPGTQMADYVRGGVTGLVFEWRPGTPAFRQVEGAELPGNNGIEVSRDGREFYVVGFGLRSVVAFARENPTRILREAVAPGFMPDNIHWDGDKLIAAGMQYDEPACGGVRKIIDGKADLMLCHRGYTVARLDPLKMTWSIVAYAEPNPSFSGVSTGVVISPNLWLGSFQSDRIAIRRLPAEGAAVPLQR